MTKLAWNSKNRKTQRGKSLKKCLKKAIKEPKKLEYSKRKILRGSKINFLLFYCTLAPKLGIMILLWSFVRVTIFSKIIVVFLQREDFI